MHQSRHLSETIESIYTGFFNPEQLSETLQRIAHFVGGDRAAILMLEPKSNSFNGYSSDNFDPETWRLYNSGWNLKDPIRLSGVKTGIDQTLLRQSVLRNDEYDDTEYFQTINQNGDLKDSIFGAFARSSRYGNSGISVYRSFSAEFFNENNAERLGLLLPHLRNARQIASDHLTDRALKSSRHSANLVFECLLRPDLSMSELAPSSEALLDKIDFLSSSLGRLQSADLSVQSMLEKLVSDARNARLSGVFFYTDRSGQKFTIRVAAIPEKVNERLPNWLGYAAILQVTCPHDGAARGRALQEFAAAMDLSQKELDFLCSLDPQKNLRETADELGISYETARWRFKQILQKTGFSGRSELFVALSSL